MKCAQCETKDVSVAFGKFCSSKCKRRFYAYTYSTDKGLKDVNKKGSRDSEGRLIYEYKVR